MRKLLEVYNNSPRSITSYPYPSGAKQYTAPKHAPQPIKRILTEDSYCVISQTHIHAEDTYTICTTCRHAFVWEHAMRWFETHNTCPHCRSHADVKHIQKYINLK